MGRARLPDPVASLRSHLGLLGAELDHRQRVPLQLDLLPAGQHLVVDGEERDVGREGRRQEGGVRRVRETERVERRAPRGASSHPSPPSTPRPAALPPRPPPRDDGDDRLTSQCHPPRPVARLTTPSRPSRPRLVRWLPTIRTRVCRGSVLRHAASCVLVEEGLPCTSAAGSGSCSGLHRGHGRAEGAAAAPSCNASISLRGLMRGGRGAVVAARVLCRNAGAIDCAGRGRDCAAEGERGQKNLELSWTGAPLDPLRPCAPHLGRPPLDGAAPR